MPTLRPGRGAVPETARAARVETPQQPARRSERGPLGCGCRRRRRSIWRPLSRRRSRLARHRRRRLAGGRRAARGRPPLPCGRRQRGAGAGLRRGHRHRLPARAGRERARARRGRGRQIGFALAVDADFFLRWPSSARCGGSGAGCWRWPGPRMPMPALRLHAETADADVHAARPVRERAARHRGRLCRRRGRRRQHHRAAVRPRDRPAVSRWRGASPATPSSSCWRRAISAG